MNNVPEFLELKSTIESWGLYVEIKEQCELHIPEKNLVIEYCDFKWNCENIDQAYRRFHSDKSNHYMNDGKQFILIFCDEYKKRKDVVISRLEHRLGANKGEVVYARKCYVEEVDVSTASSFCNKFHIQGRSGSRIKLGAFKKQDSLFGYPELISVLTMGILSRAKGNINAPANSWELARFCSDNQYRAIGTAGKLFKYFLNNYEWEFIISFADRRYSYDGNLYKKLGFELERITEPNYYYVKVPEYTHRVHRFAFRRDALRDRARKETNLPEEKIITMTELDLANYFQYKRVWDCGHYKFAMSKGELK